MTTQSELTLSLQPRRWLVLALALISIVAGSAACGSDDPAVSSDDSGETGDGSASGTTDSDTGDDNAISLANAISIADFKFDPASTTVAAGATVTWTNEDSAIHTVTGLDGGDPTDSGDIAQGDTYEFTFATPGEFSYRCNIHQTMTGSVTVT